MYLHVGVPKTGTTFIQDVLWRRRQALAADGVCYPLQQRTEHFAATMDLRGASWNGRRNPEWLGTWDRLAHVVLDSGAQRAVLSGELLAAADEAAIQRAVTSFPGWEVHIVVTVRDLARQLVSEWQEQLKHRVSLPLPDFVAATLAAQPADTHRLGRAFWQLHDLPAVLGRWGSAVPSDRVHLVTVPPPGAAGESLWDRFTAVVGIDPAHGTLPQARANTALRVVEAELLRRANAAGLDRLDPQHYDRVVRVLLAEKVLAGRPGRPLVLPAEFAAAVHDAAGRQVHALAASGYDVAGDLQELAPDLTALESAPSITPPMRSWPLPAAGRCRHSPLSWDRCSGDFALVSGRRPDRIAPALTTRWQPRRWAVPRTSAPGRWPRRRRPRRSRPPWTSACRPWSNWPGRPSRCAQPRAWG
jgi:hypothetical protein